MPGKAFRDGDTIDAKVRLNARFIDPARAAGA